MENEMTTPTGIVGNTQQQQVTATAARGTSVNKSVYWGINVAIAVAFIGIGVILAKSGLDFSWKLIVAFALIYIGGKLSKIKLPAAVSSFIWPSIIRSTGWLVLIIVLLFSGFGEITRKWGNQAEAKVTRLATQSDDCPEVGEMADVIQVTEGQRITVKRGCPLYLDQRQFAATGFVLDAVDVKFREYKPGQLINTAQNFPGVEKYPACVMDSKKVVRGFRCHMAQVTAVEWAYNELGLEEVHFIVRKAQPKEITPRLVRK
jgi:hypothetical protein